jgi:sugar lactone lactonase YvrE
MKISTIVLSCLLFISISVEAFAAPPDDALAPEFKEIAASINQWTGVAVSQCGRTFVSYPRWSDKVPVSVGELDPSGTPVPVPDAEWNSWKPGKKGHNHWVAVQSLTVDAKNRLWVLDSGNPEFKGVRPGGAKLVQLSIDGLEVKQVFRFNRPIVKNDSYLNDVRVDTRDETAYITDSGNGALIVLYLKSGSQRRVLDKHKSTQSEDIAVTINGKEWMKDGRKPTVHADGLALDLKNNLLYFQALTGRKLYRLKLSALRDPSLSAEELGKHIEEVLETGPSDGLLAGPDGAIYITSLEYNAIRRLSTDGTLQVMVKDSQLSWPDSMAWDPDGNLVVTTSRIHEGSPPLDVYKLFKLVIQNKTR